VAIFSTARIWGGAEEQARLLAVGLRKRGHDCHIFARGDSPFATRLAQQGHTVTMFRGTGRGPVSLWQIRRRLRELRPDILHANDSSALTCSGLASLGLKAGIRVAVRHNSFPIHWPARYRQLCDCLICVAGAVAQVCRTSGLPETRLRVVHAGCPRRTLTSHHRTALRRSLGVADEELLLLSAALLNPCKGHAYLLDALAAVLRRKHNIRLLLAGDGPLAAQLKDQAMQAGIADRVHFLGFRQDVPELLRAADLLVMASLQEGICSVLIEAMLAGCPVVTTTAGGIPELLDDGNPHQPLAWTVPPADTPALSSAMLDALNSGPERALRAQRARAHAEAQFTDDHMVDKTLAVYRDLLATAAETRSVQKLGKNSSEVLKT
jgi:glycosyltransferase involved in cell wall biosynthesis